MIATSVRAWSSCWTGSGSDGTFFIAQAYHCTVGTKRAELRRARVPAGAHTDHGFEESGGA
jgi:hypothetical protein